MIPGQLAKQAPEQQRGWLAPARDLRFRGRRRDRACLHVLVGLLQAHAKGSGQCQPCTMGRAVPRHGLESSSRVGVMFQHVARVIYTVCAVIRPAVCTPCVSIRIQIWDRTAAQASQQCRAFGLLSNGRTSLCKACCDLTSTAACEAADLRSSANSARGTGQ